MTYQEQIKHPEWQKKRLEILNRDEYTCQSCTESEKTLHVHHKRYIHGAKIWEYDNEFLITLCDECHQHLTRDLDDIKLRIGLRCTSPYESSTLLEIITMITNMEYFDMVHSRIILESISKISGKYYKWTETKDELPF